MSKKRNEYVKGKIIEDKNEYYKVGMCRQGNYQGESFEICEYMKELDERGVGILVDEGDGGDFGLDGFGEW